MIEKLNNFNLKSFDGYTNPDDLNFSVKNILINPTKKAPAKESAGDFFDKSHSTTLSKRLRCPTLRLMSMLCRLPQI